MVLPATRLFALGLCAATMLGCRPPSPPAAAPPVVRPGPPAPPHGVQVERIQAGLQVAPLELVFSGVRGHAGSSEAITVRNTGQQQLEVRGVAVTGAAQSPFKLEQVPPVPLVVPPGRSLALSVAFAPTADLPAGVHRAALRIVTGSDGEGLYVDLAGLVLAGKMPEHEPPLSQVVDALGFGVDVGTPNRSLGTAPGLVGQEVRAPRFKRVRQGVVSLYPIARFAAPGPLPYGTVTAGGASTGRAVITDTQAFTLNPELEPDGETTFDPGDAPFGIFAKGAARTLFTDDARNSPPGHAARVYPLKTRGGKPVADGYLIAFEDGDDSDYQDSVFVLWNVQPAP